VNTRNCPFCASPKLVHPTVEGDQQWACGTVREVEEKEMGIRWHRSPQCQQREGPDGCILGGGS
jgi:hypothetical protein